MRGVPALPLIPPCRRSAAPPKKVYLVGKSDEFKRGRASDSRTPPPGLDYSALGSRFESITQKRSIHIQPASGNTFSPEGIRIIRFNITSNDYMVPETFRVQAKFNVTDNDFVPLGPMSLLFSRVRVLSRGYSFQMKATSTD